MNPQNVLVVSPHPDDEALGVGGTIPLIKDAGGRVTVVIVTDGSSAQYPGDAEALERRHEEAANANKILGTDELIQWEFPDMRLDTVDHIELNKAFENLLQEGQYDTVFMPHASDINLDHRMVHLSVAVACRPTPTQSVRALFSYHTNSSTEWGQLSDSDTFNPNYYFDISSTLSVKLSAMEAYQSELRDFPHPRSLEAIEHRAKTVGSEVGFEAAEGFKLLFMRDALVSI